MKINEARNEGLSRDYAIIISAADLDAKISAKLTQISAEEKMPGFRPGKVPLSVVEARFGDQVKGEVIREALDEGRARRLRKMTSIWPASQLWILPLMRRARSGSAAEMRDHARYCPAGAGPA